LTAKLVLGVSLNADSRGKQLARILKIIAGAPFRQQNGDNGHSGFSRLKLAWTVNGTTRMKKIFALFAIALAFIGSAATVTTILALSA
jgi:hypothetical protein